MDTEKLNLYDSINTQAVRWLKYNSDAHAKPLGIKNFMRHIKRHMWLLHMLSNYNVFTGYNQCYYVDGLYQEYLYLRYIKKFKYLRYKKKKDDVLMIDAPQFIEELTCSFGKPASIIDDIYEEYWGNK